MDDLEGKITCLRQFYLRHAGFQVRLLSSSGFETAIEPSV